MVFDAVLRGQPAGQRPVRGRDAGRGPAPGVRLRRRQQDHPVRRAHRARRHRRRLRAGAARPSASDDRQRRRPQEAARACRSATRSPRRCSSSAAWSCSPPGWSSASRTSAGPACPAPPPSSPARATAACASSWTRVPLRATGMTPGGDPLQRVAGADVRGRARPTNVDGVPRGLREVGRARHGDRRGHRRRPAGDHLARRDGASTCRRARSPTTARCTGARWPARSAQDALVADRPTACPRPAAPSELRAEILRMAAIAEPVPAARWVTDQYDRYVRGNTVLRPARRRRDRSGSTRRPAAGSPWPPTATAGSPRSTRTPARSSRWPRPTATWRPSGAVPLAVTDCLNFGSPEDPHVMWQFERGRARPRRRLRGARHPGHRRQRQLLQPDRRRRRSCPTPVVGRARRARRRRAPGAAAGSSRDGDAVAPARGRPATSSAAASGRTSCTGTWAAGRPPVDLAAEQRLAGLLAAAAAGRAAHRRARPVRRRPRPGAGRVVPGRRARGDGRRCRACSTRSSRCSRSRPGGCW